MQFVSRHEKKKNFRLGNPKQSDPPREPRNSKKKAYDRVCPTSHPFLQGAKPLRPQTLPVYSPGTQCFPSLRDFPLPTAEGARAGRADTRADRAGRPRRPAAGREPLGHSRGDGHTARGRGAPVTEGNGAGVLLREIHAERPAAGRRRGPCPAAPGRKRALGREESAATPLCSPVPRSRGLQGARSARARSGRSRSLRARRPPFIQSQARSAPLPAPAPPCRPAVTRETGPPLPAAPLPLALPTGARACRSCRGCWSNSRPANGRWGGGAGRLGWGDVAGLRDSARHPAQARQAAPRPPHRQPLPLSPCPPAARTVPRRAKAALCSG